MRDLMKKNEMSAIKGSISHYTEVPIVDTPAAAGVMGAAAGVMAAAGVTATGRDNGGDRGNGGGRGNGGRRGNSGGRQAVVTVVAVVMSAVAAALSPTTPDWPAAWATARSWSTGTASN